MKKYLVIGNPIKHSLSPKLHNYWIKKNNIIAIYEKKKIDQKDLKNVIFKVKEGDLQGINVTVPFKKAAIPYIDYLIFLIVPMVLYSTMKSLLSSSREYKFIFINLILVCLICPILIYINYLYLDYNLLISYIIVYSLVSLSFYVYSIKKF